MAHLNHMGPENQGPKTGRMLGICHKTYEEIKESSGYKLGEGLGRKKKKGCGKGKASRSRSSEIFD